MKVFGIIALTLAVVLLTAEGKNITLGVKEFADKLLYAKVVTDKCAHYNAEKDECLTTFIYPPDGARDPFTINFISCQDDVGSDATPEITKGGLGYRSVTIELRYKPKDKINYKIEIYGRIILCAAGLCYKPKEKK